LLRHITKNSFLLRFSPAGRGNATGQRLYFNETGDGLSILPYHPDRVPNRLSPSGDGKILRHVLSAAAKKASLCLGNPGRRHAGNADKLGGQVCFRGDD
jgi:hypothetical protein